MKVSKYFWDLNDKALKETENALRDYKHPKFIMRMITLLSRCDKPQELFSLISREDFIRTWPKIKSTWSKLVRESEFRDWWDAIYEQLISLGRAQQKKSGNKSAALFLNLGNLIAERRVQKGLTQKQLAYMAGLKQPDISRIEEGKKNITLKTLALISKALGIKKIDLGQ